MITPNITTKKIKVIAEQETSNHRIYVEFEEEWTAIEFFRNLPHLIHGSRTQISFGPTCCNIGLHKLRAEDFISIYGYLEEQSEQLSKE